MENCDADVVVVGAGPTGLMSAAELRLAGVTATVLERRTEPMRQSRVLVLSGYDRGIRPAWPVAPFRSAADDPHRPFRRPVDRFPAKACPANLWRRKPTRSAATRARGSRPAALSSPPIQQRYRPAPPPYPLSPVRRGARTDARAGGAQWAGTPSASTKIPGTRLGRGWGVRRPRSAPVGHRANPGRVGRRARRFYHWAAP
jgi:choline dehydrogenase-like flavoprotein